MSSFKRLMVNIKRKIFFYLNLEFWGYKILSEYYFFYFVFYEIYINSLEDNVF